MFWVNSVLQQQQQQFLIKTLWIYDYYSVIIIMNCCMYVQFTVYGDFMNYSICHNECMPRFVRGNVVVVAVAWCIRLNIIHYYQFKNVTCYAQQTLNDHKWPIYVAVEVIFCRYIARCIHKKSFIAKLLIELMYSYGYVYQRLV